MRTWPFVLFVIELFVIAVGCLCVFWGYQDHEITHIVVGLILLRTVPDRWRRIVNMPLAPQNPIGE